MGCLIRHDFNEVLQAKDKFGGRGINNNRAINLWNCLKQYKMVDLGFKGSKYTWSKKIYKNRKNLTLERLDRVLVNDSWILK